MMALNIDKCVSISATSPHPPINSCSTIALTDSSCNFDKDMCKFQAQPNSGLKWTIATSNSDSPLAYLINESYMFLDVKNHGSMNAKASFGVKIPSHITAVCIEFQVATTGSTKYNISVYGQTNAHVHNNNDVLFDEIHNINTGGHWNTFYINTCTFHKTFNMFVKSAKMQLPHGL
ncbi:hypothetical protein Btru_060265 [Bulinus truncatus]|nr:hypothetical protein Btru_060265 [Bulinus truncatus]